MVYAHIVLCPLTTIFLGNANSGNTNVEGISKTQQFLGCTNRNIKVSFYYHYQRKWRSNGLTMFLCKCSYNKWKTLICQVSLFALDSFLNKCEYKPWFTSKLNDESILTFKLETCMFCNYFYVALGLTRQCVFCTGIFFLLYSIGSKNFVCHYCILGCLTFQTLWMPGVFTRFQWSIAGFKSREASL